MPAWPQGWEMNQATGLKDGLKLFWREWHGSGQLRQQGQRQSFGPGLAFCRVEARSAG